MGGVFTAAAGAAIGAGAAGQCDWISGVSRSVARILVAGKGGLYFVPQTYTYKYIYGMRRKIVAYVSPLLCAR